MAVPETAEWTTPKRRFWIPINERSAFKQRKIHIDNVYPRTLVCLATAVRKLPLL